MVVIANRTLLDHCLITQIIIIHDLTTVLSVQLYRYTLILNNRTKKLCNKSNKNCFTLVVVLFLVLFCSVRPLLWLLIQFYYILTAEQTGKGQAEDRQRQNLSIVDRLTNQWFESKFTVEWLHRWIRSQSNWLALNFLPFRALHGLVISLI